MNIISACGSGFDHEKYVWQSFMKLVTCSLKKLTGKNVEALALEGWRALMSPRQ